MPPGSGCGSPSTVNDTGSPAPRAWSSSSPSSPMPGCGARSEVPPSSSRRSTPSRRRISANAWRPVAEMAASASLARPGSAASAYEAPSACTTMTLTLCAITSCSSRAILARSATAAICAWASRSASSWAARSSRLA
jgi:hypothetical protein